MGKKLIPVIIGIADMILLGVIIVSVTTGWRITEKSHTPNIVSAATEKHSEATQKATADSQATETSEKETSAPETEPTQQVTAFVTEPVTAKETPTQAPKQKEDFPAVEEVTTENAPTLADIQGFSWNKDKGAYWSIVEPEKSEELNVFKAIQGGWKAYFLDDPAMKRSEYAVEHLGNINISGSEKVTKVTVSWVYTFLGEQGEGHDDNSPASTFYGVWSEGKIEATGSGKITLSKFYYSGGREYAVGEMMWPDGVESAVALVRP